MAKSTSPRFYGVREPSGVCRVTFGGKDVDPRLDLFYHSRDGFDWGYMGAGPLQLAFAILMHFCEEKDARFFKTRFAKDIIAALTEKEWYLDADRVRDWLYEHGGQSCVLPELRKDKKESNVVKSVCRELGITQKRLAEILEVPEGTVSSWAVKNEIPRLGKKAIEFYLQSRRNAEIVERFKVLLKLVDEA